MILDYHENLVTIPFILSLWFDIENEPNLAKDIVTAIVRGGKWSSLKLHFYQLLYWTGQYNLERQIEIWNVRICSKSRLLCSKSWYGATRDCKIIYNAFILKTVSSNKKRSM